MCGQRTGPHPGRNLLTKIAEMTLSGRIAAYNRTASVENAAVADSWKTPRMAALAIAMRATAMQARTKLRITNLLQSRRA